LAAGKARARSIAKGFCDERATLPAAKITSQVATFIYLRFLGGGRGAGRKREDIELYSITPKALWIQIRWESRCSLPKNRRPKGILYWQQRQMYFVVTNLQDGWPWRTSQICCPA
jgi:hypothetical protein